MIDFEKIKDRYGNPLKKPDKLPTLEQSILSWALVNELLACGYCHDFQRERSDIADYIWRISEMLDKAKAIIFEDEGGIMGVADAIIFEEAPRNAE